MSVTNRRGRQAASGRTFHPTLVLPPVAPCAVNPKPPESSPAPAIDLRAVCGPKAAWDVGGPARTADWTPPFGKESPRPAVAEAVRDFGGVVLAVSSTAGSAAERPKDGGREWNGTLRPHTLALDRIGGGWRRTQPN